MEKEIISKDIYVKKTLTMQLKVWNSVNSRKKRTQKKSSAKKLKLARSLKELNQLRKA